MPVPALVAFMLMFPMKKIVLWCALAALCWQVQAAEFRGLCEKEEQVVFACQLKKQKVVSLCASAKLDQRAGYLQYRFGVPGKPPELEYPALRSHPRGQFVRGYYLWASAGMHWIGFDNGGYHYAIGSAGGRGIDQSGVWVVQQDKLLRHLPCSGQSSDNQQSAPLQQTLETLLPQDTVEMELLVQ